MTEMVEYLDPRILKPDPNQPRQPDWSSEEVRKELKLLSETFEAQNVINPIEIDENNYIILGERRWRATLLKGLEKIPVRRMAGLTQRDRFERQLIDDAQRIQLTPQEKVWAYTTSVVNINTKGNYTVSEIKRMYERDHKQLLGLITATSEKDKQGRQKRMGQSLLARTIGISQSTVSQYLSWFKVGFELQEAFMVGEIPIEYVWRVASLFDNDKFERTEEQIRLEKEILSGKIESSDQLAMIISETRTQIEERRVEAAREIIPAIVPEVEKPETPEELKEAAKALKREAKRKEEEKKTPEQRAAEKAEKEHIKREAAEKKRKDLEEKAQKSLLNGRANAKSKIEKAIVAGVDVTEFNARLKQIEVMISENPEEAFNEAEILKDDIDTAIHDEEIRREADEKAREEERKKIEVERERLEAEAEEKLEARKEELRKDRKFISEVRREIISPPIPKVEAEKRPPRIIKSIDEPVHTISVGLDRETFMKLSDFMKARDLMLEDAIIFLIMKGLESITVGNS